MCSKRRYSKAGAKRVLKRMLTAGATGVGGHGLEIYRCPICDYWHLGHARGWKTDQQEYSDARNL